MQDLGADGEAARRQAFAVTAAAVSRAIAACRPLGTLQNTERVVVTAKLAPQQQHLQVSGMSEAPSYAGILLKFLPVPRC